MKTIKKLLVCICSILVIFSLTSSVFAANVISNDIAPQAFGTTTGRTLIYVNIPSYTMRNGVTESAWSCPIYISYKMTYNLNNGVITSVESLGADIPGTAVSPTGRCQLTGLNYDRVELKIINSGNMIQCKFSATADLLYVDPPGLPIYQESTVTSVSSTTSFDPPRP